MPPTIPRQTQPAIGTLLVLAAGLGIGLTGLSYALGLWLGWIATVSWLEAFAVATSYAATFLSVRQSRATYPVGMVSVAALTVLFWRQGLYSSALLNAYLVPTLLYGWFRWGADSATRPVTRLRFDAWLLAYGGITAGTYLALRALTSWMGATLPAADSAILVLTILAQFLLDNKKIETWIVWAAVNVLAATVYWEAGLRVVAVQFVLFLANTVYGWTQWRRSMPATSSPQ